MTSTFCNKLAGIAETEHHRYHLIHEADDPLRTQIKAYWAAAGLDPQPVSEAWSAAFVSWCVEQAGATAAEFKFSSAHSKFVHKAIADAAAGIGVFHGIDPATAKPGVGDIIQNNRGGRTYDFAHAKANKNYKSHSAIVIETGTDRLGRYALTVGGNESDSIRRVRVALKPDGTIKLRTDDPYIAVVKTLK